MANTTVPAELINTATPLGRRNILINGDFGIYQRAQQVTDIGASTGYFTADRWHIDTGDSAGRLTMTAGTADAPAESNVTTSMKLDCTTADTSIAAGEYLTLNQKIEGQNIQHIKKGTSGAKQLTASFWVKGNASATYVAELYDVDNARQISKTFAVTSSWSKIELTFPADTTGAFGNDANNSLVMNIWIHAGSTFTSGTLNSSAWAAQTAANRAAGISSFYSSTSNELYITAVQLEVDDVATEFEVLSYPERLALCQRYFQIFKGFGTSSAVMNHHNRTTTQRYGCLNLPVDTRVSPTLGYSALSDFTSFVASTSATPTAIVNQGSTGHSIEIYITTAANGTAGQAGWLRVANGGYLTLDAEL